MEQAERDHVAHAQRLVDDGVGVRHVDKIIHGGLSGPANHSVYLSLDLFCTSGQDENNPLKSLVLFFVSNPVPGSLIMSWLWGGGAASR